MNYNLYFLKNFNNYFNRIVKRYDDKQAYLNVVGEDNYFLLENTNFVPNDGITTVHVVGNATNPYEKDWNPDYCIVCDENDNIVSRWYITEFTRLMSNQYRASFKRDSVVDKITTILSNPAFVEKAIIQDSDPFIINNEGIQFNQIKKREYYLKDETKVPWVIVYLAQDREGTDEDEKGRKGFKVESLYYGDAKSADIEDVPELQKLFDILPDDKKATYNVAIKDSLKFEFAKETFLFNQIFPPIPWSRSEKVIANYNNNSINYEGDSTGPIPSKFGFEDFCLNNLAWHEAGYTGNDETTQMMINVFNDIRNNVGFYKFIEPIMVMHSLKREEDLPVLDEEIEKWNNKIVYSRTTRKYYKVKFSKKDIEELRTEHRDQFYNNNFYPIFKKFNQGDWIFAYRPEIDEHIIDSILQKKTVNYEFEEQLSGTIETFIPNKMFQNTDAPYDIVAFPLGSTIIKNGDEDYAKCRADVALDIARAISSYLGENCYDVQVLPYFPMQDLIVGNNVDLKNAPVESWINVRDVEKDETLSVGIFAKKSRFEVDIYKLGTSLYNDEERPISSETTITNRKIQANCDLWRLCSPNFASQFEFNIAKCVNLNKPYLNKFSADCTYRPINPYIHINPDFGFLYGEDFNDSRGLIFSGDFSITTMKDAWREYEIQNKNYQNSFDRQIQNMETNRQIAREQDEWNIATTSTNAGLGVLKSIAGGFVGGMLSGNPKRAVAGSIIGGVAGAVSGGMSIGGAVKQKEWNERAYQEQRSFATDQFNMNMDNIKALPNTISHSSTLSNNYKFYPVLEYYTCTDEEKIALVNKIRYNGMTVGRIAHSLNEFISMNEEVFIKAQMIRLIGLGEDSHLANDIYEEINKGLFFEPYRPSNKEK